MKLKLSWNKVWQNNEVEVKPIETMFCGFIPPVEAEMSFTNSFTSEARPKISFGIASLEALREAVPNGP